MTKGTRDPALAKPMLHTLGDIGDPRGAKYIKPYLRQRDPKKAPDLLKVAVAVSAEVCDASLVGPLLKIVLKSKTYADTKAREKARKIFNKIEKYI